MRPPHDVTTVKTSKPTGTQQLVDPVGRRIRKLRISLLDACNFRCFYCMPEHARFMNRKQLLSVAELVSISAELCALGISQIRVTGGEPTLRPEFCQIMTALSKLKIERLGLTTNGVLLSQHLDFLANETNCRHINISLDSLKPDVFYRITRRNQFHTVLASIEQANAKGFNVKVNMVLMRGVNDEEIMDFVNFSQKLGIEVRFLEVMRIGEVCDQQGDLFMPAQEAIAKIKEHETLIPQSREKDATSFNFYTTSGAQIGFIASESQPFCGQCSRWRLTADGHLRACLMSSQGVHLRGLPPETYGPLLKKLLTMKPTHRIYEVRDKMHAIGG